MHSLPWREGGGMNHLCGKYVWWDICIVVVCKTRWGGGKDNWISRMGVGVFPFLGWGDLGVRI